VNGRNRDIKHWIDNKEILLQKDAFQNLFRLFVANFKISTSANVGNIKIGVDHEL